MRAVIISGGSITNYEYIGAQIKPNDTIICADSGYNHALKLGVIPSAIVGDFDSIGEIPNNITCLRYPTKKDLTDTEIAIEYARSKGFNEYLILAATGSRVDHSLANILLLKDILDQRENAVLINENNKVMITNSFLELQEAPGSIVSLVPITNCLGVTTTNLEYPLHDAKMYVGKSLGVSNVIIKETASVSVSAGVLLVIVAND